MATARNEDRGRGFKGLLPSIMLGAALLGSTLATGTAQAQYGYDDTAYDAWWDDFWWWYGFDDSSIGTDWDYDTGPTGTGSTGTQPTSGTGVSPSVGSGGSGRRHMALCIGINRYARPGNDLSGCVNDAMNVRARLLNDSRWSAANVELLTDTRATKSAVRSRLMQLGSSTGPGDVVVFYQSSHGSWEGGLNTSLVMHDQHYSDREFGADVGSALSDGTTVIVVIDACHSGGLFKSGVSSREQREAVNAAFIANALNAMDQARAARDPSARSRPASNVAFITAADFNQYSYENSSGGTPGGIFTRHFTAAFSNVAADQDGNRHMSFWELGVFAARRASEEKPAQTAQFFNENLLHAAVASNLQSGSISVDGGGSQTTLVGNGSGGGNSGSYYTPALVSGSSCGALGVTAPLALTMGLVAAAAARTRSACRRKVRAQRPSGSTSRLPHRRGVG